MSKIDNETQTVVLSFMRAANQATVVTDGHHFRTYESEHCKNFPSLARAIAYLEANGYNIVIE